MNVAQFKNRLPPRDYAEFLAKQQEQYVRQAGEFRDEVEDILLNGVEVIGDPLPWAKTRDKIRLRPGEVTLWAGARGSFKSMVTGMVATWLMRHGRVLLASLEMQPKMTLARMLQQAAGKHGPTPELRDQFFATANDRLWMYDQIGEVDMDSALGLVTYAAEHLMARHIFWDSMMMAGIDHEDYDAQRKFTAALVDIAKRSGAHIHLVAHLRKSSSPEYIPNSNDVKGASEIGNLASNIILVWANKPKVHARSRGEQVNVNDPDLRLIVDKQRHGEFEGHIGLFFHRNCLQFIERPMNDAVLELL